MEVVIVDSKNSFGQQGSTRKVMKRTFNGGDYVYEKGFAVGDINKDGKVEFLQQYWLSNGTPFIRLYDNDGEDITSQWLGDNFMETAINGGGNGFTFIDLNNDKSWVKPLALQKYIDEETPSVIAEIKNIKTRDE